MAFLPLLGPDTHDAECPRRQTERPAHDDLHGSVVRGSPSRGLRGPGRRDARAGVSARAVPTLAGLGEAWTPRAGRVPRARPSLLHSAPLLLLGALCLFPAAPAAAQSVLVSNIGQATGFTTSFSSQKVQGFTTGSHAAGYTLASIEVDMVVTGTLSATHLASLRMELWSDNGSARPGSKEADLTVPASISTGAVAFAAPANTTLTASTTYFVVMYSTGAGRVESQLEVRTTSSQSEDSGAAAGWSIADIGLFRQWNRPRIGNDLEHIRLSEKDPRERRGGVGRPTRRSHGFGGDAGRDAAGVGMDGAVGLADGLRRALHVVDERCERRGGGFGGGDGVGGGFGVGDGHVAHDHGPDEQHAVPGAGAGEQRRGLGSVGVRDGHAEGDRRPARRTRR